MPLKRRFIVILFGLLAASVIYVLDSGFVANNGHLKRSNVNREEKSSIPIEQSFSAGQLALLYQKLAKVETSGRELSAYYANRAYPGAPPTIPHTLIDPNASGGKSCLKCHENGGFAPVFNAYTPITPHPNLLNCVQCHVPQKSNARFTESTFRRPPGPTLGNASLINGPPVIPHTLHLRENCLACHAGPAAPRQIRVSHPERVNCRQCHAAPFDAARMWTRKDSI